VTRGTLEKSRSRLLVVTARLKFRPVDSNIHVIQELLLGEFGEESQEETDEESIKEEEDATVKTEAQKTFESIVK
jgi:hypothetical protein